MPFDAVPRKGFSNREDELGHLRRLASGGAMPSSRNVIVAGGRGIGKSEILKQLYGSLFWEDGPVPFYYRFLGASLRGDSFARDYLSSFVRQFIACTKRDPALAEAYGTPLSRLAASWPGQPRMVIADLVENFMDQMSEGDLVARVRTALSAPAVVAAATGRRVVVMLDDFHLASGIYDTRPGDLPGAVGLFGDALKSTLCTYVLTGSSEAALECSFSDSSLRGSAERLVLGPLPEDDAFELFRDLCSTLGLDVTDECSGAASRLGGVPLYIRSIARSLWRFRRTRVDPAAFWECYAYEVTRGETAFYWSSVLREALAEADQRRLGLEVLRQSLEGPLDVLDTARLARAFGVGDSSIRTVLRALEAAGAIRTEGSIRPVPDMVFKDYVRCLYAVEVEGKDDARAQEAVVERNRPSAQPVSRFEMTIPMNSQAELVAAKAAEQICARVRLKREVVEQLQLAIIEACINAMEHSGSYDKRVFLKFELWPDRLEIAIESPGRPFEPDEPATAPAAGAEGPPPKGRRRGWGLRLMRMMTDDVRVERTVDGTRVVLVKKIDPEEVIR